MQRATYYREQAERARRLARHSTGDVHQTLNRLAKDFDEIAKDLENGAVEIVHPERMPQGR
jgi:hypothetical protein